MYRTMILAGAILVVTGLSLAQAPDITRMDVVERSVPPGPVAIVDGVAIEGSDFLREYRRHLRNVVLMMDMPEVAEDFRVHAGLTILGDMIRHEILLKEGQRRGISVSDSEVEKEYAEKLAQFEAMLAEETGAPVTEAKVLERAGQTREEARASIRDQIIVDKVSDMIAREKGFSVSNEDVKSYYDNNPHLFRRAGGMHLNQILIIPKPSAARADETAWSRAEESANHARARILAGEQFAAVARDVSEAPDAPKGGDLGMLPSIELPPFFVEVAATLKPGGLSEVFRSEFGVHLIRLIATESEEGVSLKDADEPIRRMLTHLKVEEAALQFCEPIVNDTQRTKVFIQLDRTLAALGGPPE